MSKPLDVAELKRLIEDIDLRLCLVPDWIYEDRESWKRHDAALGKIIDHLVENEQAAFRPASFGAYSLRLAGVRTSCTSGEHGLLKNWIIAARRAIDQAEGQSS